MGWVTAYITSHPGPLSLAIPLWVGAMSTVLAMVTATVMEENGQFCVRPGLLVY